MSCKAVKFAVGLLESDLGMDKVDDIMQAVGRDVLSLISHLSPNVRKYRGTEGRSQRTGRALQAGEPGRVLGAANPSKAREAHSAIT